MKNIILTLCFIIASSSLASDSIQQVKLKIKRLSDRIYEEVDYTDAKLKDLEVVLGLMERSKKIIYGQTSSDDFKKKCIKSILDRGYGPSTAKAVCQKITTNMEFQCLNFVLDKGYGTSTATSSCAMMSEESFSCFKDVMDRGYSPSTARNTCL